MKVIILYMLLFFFAISCKTDIKQTVKTVKNITVKKDTVKTKKQKQDKNNNLKAKLIGVIYRKAYEIPEFKGLSSGGYLIGNVFNNKHIYNGKTYSLDILREDNDIIKYVLLTNKEFPQEKKWGFKILDLIEIDKETNAIRLNPNKEIVIFSDVLQNGKPAPELFALAAYEEAEVMTEVYKVWRANRKTGKLEEIKDLTNITVIDEDF